MCSTACCCCPGPQSSWTTLSALSSQLLTAPDLQSSVASECAWPSTLASQTPSRYESPSKQPAVSNSSLGHRKITLREMSCEQCTSELNNAWGKSKRTLGRYVSYLLGHASCCLLHFRHLHAAVTPCCQLIWRRAVLLSAML